MALDGEREFHLRYMENSLNSEDGQYDASKFIVLHLIDLSNIDRFRDKSSAMVASMVLAFARACGTDHNTDDILTIALRQMTAGEYYQ